jgi:hypothetical protein
MKREEFEEYLISIDGVYDWKSLTSTNPSMFGVGEGWFELLKNLIDELISLGWDRHLIQSKEKFGGLCFFIKNTTQEMREVILTYEQMSYSICEECGEEGERRKGGWMKTLCDKHAEERENKIKTKEL